MTEIPTHYAERKIHLINGRCGGNKTGYITERIDQLLAEEPEQCIVYAAPTKKVLSEVSINRLHTNRKTVIASSDNPDEKQPSTLSRVSELLTNGYHGCLLITHTTLFRIRPELLRNKLVIIDESPEGVVKFEHFETSIINEHKTNSNNINELLSLSKTIETHKNNIVKVKVEPKYHHYIKKQIDALIRNIQNLKNESLKDDDEIKKVEINEKIEFINKIINIFKSALYEHGYLYKTEISGKLILRSLCYQSIIDIMENARSIWIASADFEYNLLHFILTRLHKYPVSVISDTGIPLKHEKSEVLIYPVMGKDIEWSRSLYERDQTELNIFINPERSNQHQRSIFEECFDFSTHLIKCEIYDLADKGLYGKETPKNLLFVNINKKSETSRDSFIHISTVSHGINEYVDSHNAAWLAATVPTPDEFYSLNWFGIENELDCEELKQALKHTRIYSQIYQGIARTSLRHDKNDMKNIFVVPDYKSAIELLKWIPKAKIDTSYCYSLRKLEEERDNIEEEKWLAITIFSHLKKVKHGKKASVYKSYNLDAKQIQRLKEKHIDILTLYDLLPLKSDDVDILEKIKNLKKEGITTKEACNVVGISESTYKRRKRKAENSKH
ncbi:TPA: hypothetical protein NJY97_003664 [Vibrio parahaemolyticus]|nr:hypothetical protein [Vibrio parahaemolyticus]HCE1607494.1 hypothetical protein [Vibrio parahaemolyticus]HCE5230432.1 hypothetical protein [Vibrio parahaemolyticus]HCG5109949.1 hypothetical protein [Vibrio parahaemolyticus]HCG5119059.1 hypothetical protein [Vibrio parahaemolyticus]